MVRVLRMVDQERMTDGDTALRLLDAGSSVGVLVALVVLFVRGDILPRKSVEEIIASTVSQVLAQLREETRDRRRREREEREG